MQSFRLLPMVDQPLVDVLTHCAHPKIGPAAMNSRELTQIEATQATCMRGSDLLLDSNEHLATEIAQSRAQDGNGNVIVVGLTRYGRTPGIGG